MWSERDVDTDVREKRTSPVTGDWSKRSGDTGVSGIPSETHRTSDQWTSTLRINRQYCQVLYLIGQPTERNAAHSTYIRINTL